jgi:yecA family protein
MDDKFPSYETVDAALETLNSLGRASDTHGLLSAMFVGCVAIRPNAWLDSLLAQTVDANDAISKGAVRVLERLFLLTQESLESTDFEFDLLLPDDEESLEERIEALSAWCQGFVSGLQLVGIHLDTVSNEESREALQDLVKMSCLAYDEEESGDSDDEAAYTELLEYARTAVMLLYEDIRKQKSGVQHSREVH